MSNINVSYIIIGATADRADGNAMATWKMTNKVSEVVQESCLEIRMLCILGYHT